MRGTCRFAMAMAAQVGRLQAALTILAAAALVGTAYVAFFGLPDRQASGGIYHSAVAPSGKCEGYWPDAGFCLALGTGPKACSARNGAGSAGCPQCRMAPDGEFPGKDTFLAKLRALEALAQTANDVQRKFGTCKQLREVPSVKLMHYRGLSWSRIQPNVIVGSGEFQDGRGENLGCWPQGYADHYVERHGVIPSERFDAYVREFDLEGFRWALATCSGVKTPASALLSS
ncbi:unnamed protein product [Polarella glacialis]|uniref:Uncharacterized protein n=1 Tax=Polarella glacialis TaxID=89957 RepID=A0A813D924_POLGL|nr:unnamed protein product [Polarella glacialis]